MKKSILLLSTVALLGLASCGGAAKQEVTLEKAREQLKANSEKECPKYIKSVTVSAVAEFNALINGEPSVELKAQLKATLAGEFGLPEDFDVGYEESIEEEIENIENERADDTALEETEGAKYYLLDGKVGFEIVGSETNSDGGFEMTVTTTMETRFNEYSLPEYSRIAMGMSYTLQGQTVAVNFAMEATTSYTL